VQPLVADDRRSRQEAFFSKVAKSETVMRFNDDVEQYVMKGSRGHRPSDVCALCTSSAFCSLACRDLPRCLQRIKSDP
jgi:hypothetical protein